MLQPRTAAWEGSEVAYAERLGQLGRLRPGHPSNQHPFYHATHATPVDDEHLARKSLFLDGLARQIAGATYATQLKAIEIDFFTDDPYKRDGELVVLNVDAQVATALASRDYVDMTYLTHKINIDGFGQPAWGRCHRRDAPKRRRIGRTNAITAVKNALAIRLLEKDARALSRYGPLVGLVW